MSLSVGLLATPSHGKIGPHEIKGIQSLLTPQCDSLSPLYGLTLLHTGILERIRFHGNYGPENSQYPCHPLIPKNRRQKDCPQDHTTALIQALFPSPGASQLVVNGGSTDPMGRMGSEILGKILQKTQTHLPEVVKASVSLPTIEMELSRIIYEDLYRKLEPKKKDFKLRQKRADKLRTMIQNAEKKLTEIQLDRAPAQQVQSLQATLFQVRDDLALTEERMNDQINAEVNRVKHSKEWKRIQSFVHSFLGSFHEASSPDSIYSENIAKQVVLAYFWSKARTKEEILRLLHEIPTCIAPEKQSWLGNAFTHFPEFHEEELRKKREWITESFSKQEYEDWKQKIQGDLGDAQVQELALDPERLIYYALSFEASDRKGQAGSPDWRETAALPILKKILSLPNPYEAEAREDLITWLIRSENFSQVHSLRKHLKWIWALPVPDREINPQIWDLLLEPQIAPASRAVIEKLRNP